MSDAITAFLARAERLMDRIEAVLPQPLASPTGAQSDRLALPQAQQWPRRHLEPVRHMSAPSAR
jgi:hypothetical protein